MTIPIVTPMGTITDRQTLAISAVENMSIQKCLCNVQMSNERRFTKPGETCIPCKARLVLNALTTCANEQCKHSIFDHYANNQAGCSFPGCPGCLSYQ